MLDSDRCARLTRSTPSRAIITAFALMVPFELCVHGGGIDGARCTTQSLSSPVIDLVLVAGSIMMLRGGQIIWQNTRLSGTSEGI